MGVPTITIAAVQHSGRGLPDEDAERDRQTTLSRVVQYTVG